MLLPPLTRRAERSTVSTPSAVWRSLPEPSAAATETTGFRQETASVDFRTNSAAAFALTADTLYSYRRADPGDAGCRVAVHIVPDLRWDECRAAFSHAPRHEIGPALVARALRTGTGSEYWVDEHRTLIRKDPEAAVITAYCASEDAARH